MYSEITNKVNEISVGALLDVITLSYTFIMYNIGTIPKISTMAVTIKAK
jgi:hypothetical protein